MRISSAFDGTLAAISDVIPRRSSASTAGGRPWADCRGISENT